MFCSSSDCRWSFQKVVSKFMERLGRYSWEMRLLPVSSPSYQTAIGLELESIQTKGSINCYKSYFETYIYIESIITGAVWGSLRPSHVK